MREMNFADCFVQLLGFSKDSRGYPGLDIETETYFLIFELGDSSLNEVLAQCKREENTLSKDELRSLHWALVSIVCGLHNEGYVHLDIKPVNIVRFRAAAKAGGGDGEGGEEKWQWKLIDLDGAMKTGSEVPLTGVVFTPQYMAPELASAWRTARKDKENREASQDPPRLKLSRLMDIWSVGLTALEAIFLTPVLDPWYGQWMEETGSDAKYLDWLSDNTTDPIVSGSMQEALNEIDRDMCRFLKGMLSKDPKLRQSITECVNHAWLKPIRMEIQRDIDEIVAQSLTGSHTTVSNVPKTPSSGPRSRMVTSSSEASQNSTLLVSESSRGMMPTGTERARIVVKGVKTRTCVTM